MKRKIILLTISVLSLILLATCDLCPDPSRGDPFAWSTESPEDHGMDTAQLQTALDEAQKRSHIWSVLVIKDEAIVAERYYRGHDVNSSHNIRSVSKSFLSAMTGIAIEEGYLSGTDEKMLEYFPEYTTTGMDSRKRDITIEHLLTMSAGMEHEHNNYFKLYNTSNWILSAIEEPLIFDPGADFSYNTFLTHTLSGILTKATEKSTFDFGQEFLCDPMGTEIADWQQGPQGIYFGGNSMFFTTRDMAMLGILYMNYGEISGEQIVPVNWVQQSIQRQAPVSGWNWGELHNGGYGYLWWVGEIKDYEVFLAIGHGGQFVICFPALDMIVATNSNAYLGWDQSNKNEESVVELVANYILPAVK